MNAFAHNAFAASGGISQTAADARYARLASANTFSAAQTFSVNGAASTPPLALTGTIFTGGSATTTKPALLIEPTGTTSTGWQTGGTLLGVNAPSGFTNPENSLLDLQVNGVSYWRFNAYSNEGMVCKGTSILTPNFSGIGRLLILGGVGGIFMDGSGVVQVCSTTKWGWSSSGTSPGSAGMDAGFSRVSAGAIRTNDGSTGYSSFDASAYKVGGVAGASGTGTVISAITVTNGIITSITVA